MTFLDPLSEPRTRKPQAENPPTLAPWTQRRLLLVGLPVCSGVMLGVATWLLVVRQLGHWLIPVVLAAMFIISASWSIRAIRKGEWTIIRIWETIGKAIPGNDRYKYARRIDSSFVGEHGGRMVTVSPVPILSQEELDRIAHRVATAEMLRAEPVEIVNNPHRFRRGKSAKFGFVPK